MSASRRFQFRVLNPNANVSTLTVRVSEFQKTSGKFERKPNLDFELQSQKQERIAKLSHLMSENKDYFDENDDDDDYESDDNIQVTVPVNDVIYKQNIDKKTINSQILKSSFINSFESSSILAEITEEEVVEKIKLDALFASQQPEVNQDDMQPFTHPTIKADQLTGFFYQVSLSEEDSKEQEDITIEREARVLLEMLQELHNQGYQEVYFTCPLSQSAANEIEKAYQKGERITHAVKESSRGRQEKLMAKIESLLQKEHYKQLHSFYIAPISTSLHQGGLGQAEDARVKSQLESIKQKMQQGHAVICLTDQQSLNNKKPFPLGAGDYNRRTFTPALSCLTQSKFDEYEQKYKVPEKIKNLIEGNIKNLTNVKKINQKKEKNLVTENKKKKLTNQMKSETIDHYYFTDEQDKRKILFEILNNNALLKTWPLHLPRNLNSFITKQNVTTLMQAVTIEQKEAFIKDLIKEIDNKYARGALDEPETEEKEVEEEGGIKDKNCDFLIAKYRYKLNEYAEKWRWIKETGELDLDFSSEKNRVALANILIDALKKSQKNRGQFFEVIDSVESYARQLRGSHSQLYGILSDLVWEASFLREKVKQNNQSLKTIPKTEEILSEVNSDANYNVEKNNPAFQSSFYTSISKSKTKEKEDEDLLSNMKAALIRNIDRAKKYGQMEKGSFFHSKNLTAERLKKIDVNDIDEFQLILHAEINGQAASKKTFFPDEMTKALKKTMDKLTSSCPPLFSSRMRRFSLNHASQLLQYVNERERSLLYKRIRKKATNYETFPTTKSARIYFAGKYAHELLTAKTPADLYKVILKLSMYKQKLIKDSESSSSLLIDIIDNMEYQFKKAFKFQPILEEQDIDTIWREEFGNESYMKEKFKAVSRKIERVYPEDQATVDILMNDKDRKNLENYFKKIKMDWGTDIYVSHPFRQEITKYLANNANNVKSVEDISFKTMVALLFKIRLNESAPPLTLTESRLLSNVVIKQKNQLIQQNGFNSIYHIIENNIDVDENIDDDASLIRNRDKEWIIKRILPCLIDASINHPNGFRVMITNIGNKNNFFQLLQEIIRENQSLIKNLKVVHYIGENQSVETELDNNITYIKAPDHTLPATQSNLINKYPVVGCVEGVPAKEPNLEIKVGKIFTLGEFNPEHVLQKRCYDLLNQPKGSNDLNNNVRHARLCALAIALSSSGYDSNRQLGLHLREKIGPSVLETTRRQFPAIYYAELCLAMLNEIETTRDNWNESLQNYLTDFIEKNTGDAAKTGEDVYALYSKISHLCDDIEKEEAGNVLTRFFTKKSNLRAFLEKFNRNFKENCPSLVERINFYKQQASFLH